MAFLAISGAAAEHSLAHNGSTPAGVNGSNATTACFLNQFRKLKPAQAAQQGINLTHTAHFNIGSTVFDVVLMVVGAVFLFLGAKVTKLSLFVGGFGVGALACFFATSNIFSALQFFNCYLLGIVPLVGGLLLGVIVLKLLKLAFFAIGGSTGAILGYYVYVLVLVGQAPTPPATFIIRRRFCASHQPDSG